jgi:hypothetical protein
MHGVVANRLRGSYGVMLRDVGGGMRTNIRYILTTAMRDRLFIGLLLAVAAAAYISSVLGSTAMLEPQQMTLAFTAASSRLILMVGMIVFIVFHVRAAFENP